MQLLPTCRSRSSKVKVNIILYVEIQHHFPGFCMLISLLRIHNIDLVYLEIYKNLTETNFVPSVTEKVPSAAIQLQAHLSC